MFGIQISTDSSSDTQASLCCHRIWKIHSAFLTYLAVVYWRIQFSIVREESDKKKRSAKGKMCTSTKQTKVNQAKGLFVCFNAVLCFANQITIFFLMCTDTFYPRLPWENMLLFCFLRVCSPRDFWLLKLFTFVRSSNEKMACTFFWAFQSHRFFGKL